MDAVTLKKLVAETARNLGEEENTKDAIVQQFKDWLNQCPNILNYDGDDVVPLAFLRREKFSVARAQEKLLRTLMFKVNFPEINYDADILDPKVSSIVKKGCVYQSPFVDHNGRHVVCVDMCKAVLQKDSYIDFLRAIVSAYITMKCNENIQVMGYVIVFDLRDFTPAHLTYIPLKELLEMTLALQNILPLKLKGCHIVNMPAPAKFIFDLIINNSSEKMKKRYMIHSSPEELHKHVYPEVLPKELGGKMPMQEMIDLWYNELLFRRERVMNNCKLTLVQMEHEDLKSCLADLPGTFRKLEVD